MGVTVCAQMIPVPAYDAQEKDELTCQLADLQKQYTTASAKKGTTAAAASAALAAVLSEVRAERLTATDAEDRIREIEVGHMPDVGEATAVLGGTTNRAMRRAGAAVDGAASGMQTI